MDTSFVMENTLAESAQDHKGISEDTSEVKSATFSAEKETEQMNNGKEDKTFPNVSSFAVKWQKPM